MLILIDESGETGFKDKSSRYFILTMIIFTDEDKNKRYKSAEDTANIIRNTLETTRHKPEFRFSSCSHTIRRSFFQALNDHQCYFDICSLVVDKSNIHSEHLRKNPSAFYNFILKQLLSQNSVQNAKIKIDGQKNKVFRKALTTYLKRDNDGMLAKLKFADSKKDVLIQLADMVCGAIAYSYKDKLDSETYLKMLGNRVKNIWVFK